MLERLNVHCAPTLLGLVRPTDPNMPSDRKLRLDCAAGAGEAAMVRPSRKYPRIYIGHLRQKLGDDPADPRYISNEPGVGYRLLEEAG
jgi:hypothetical protein